MTDDLWIERVEALCREAGVTLTPWERDMLIGAMNGTPYTVMTPRMSGRSVALRQLTELLEGGA
jgi:hypothetical protein